MKQIIIKTPKGFSDLLLSPGHWHQLKNIYFEVFNDFFTEWCVLNPGIISTKQMDDSLIVQRAYYNLITNRFIKDGQLVVPEYIDAMPEANNIMAGLDSLYFTVRIINAVFDSHGKRQQVRLTPINNPEEEENYRRICKIFQNALLEYTCLTFITAATTQDFDNTIPSVE